ncbi:MAG: lamin tail domain-containing protein [Candidatus Shapirobacteria bacterium]|nr:lamin tail domain-containing protein [Candidatus Shapirobacteria bacterium]
MVFLFFILCFFLPKFVFAESSVKISGYSATSPEFIKLKNNSDAIVDITGWYFKDLADNKKTISYTSISANAEIQIDFASSWINDSGDTVYLYDVANTLVDTLVYIVPTKTPTPTSVPTAIPTTDPTIVNPTSGITMTEFMPYSDPEWIEIRNNNDKPVKLIGWKLEDKDGHTRNMGENGVLSISANSYYVFEYSPFFDNNNDETVIFRRQDNTIVNQSSYSGGLRTLDRSWSSINNSWCQSSITKGYENVSSCYSAPTATPIPTNTPTPTPDQSKFTSSDTATESAIIEPLSGSNFITSNPSSTPTDIKILGDDITNTTKKNYLPLILIISGGLLLTSPVIISKLKK